MFTGWDRPSHWLVLAIVVVVLFGYKKLPDAARSIGRSLRVFKTEIKGMSDDDATRAAAADQAAATPGKADVPVADVPAGNLPSGERQAAAADQPADQQRDHAEGAKPASQPTTPGTV